MVTDVWMALLYLLQRPNVAGKPRWRGIASFRRGAGWQNASNGKSYVVIIDGDLFKNPVSGQ
jgi:hypothetical protein